MRHILFAYQLRGSVWVLPTCWLLATVLLWTFRDVFLCGCMVRVFMDELVSTRPPLGGALSCHLWFWPLGLLGQWGPVGFDAPGAGFSPGWPCLPFFCFRLSERVRGTLVLPPAAPGKVRDQGSLSYPLPGAIRGPQVSGIDPRLHFL